MIAMGDFVGGLGGATGVGFPEPTGTTSLTNGTDTSNAVPGRTTAAAANVNNDKGLLHWSAALVVVALILLWLLGGIVFKVRS